MSRTFGWTLTAQADVQAAVVAFLIRAAEKLRAQGEQAYVLTVFVQKNRSTYGCRLLTPARPRLYCLATVSRHAGTCPVRYPPTQQALEARYHISQGWLSARWFGAAQHRLADGSVCPYCTGGCGTYHTTEGHQPPSMATLDATRCMGASGAAQLGSAIPAGPTGMRPLWLGQAQGQSGAFTMRLEDLLIVS